MNVQEKSPVGVVSLTEQKEGNTAIIAQTSRYITAGEIARELGRSNSFAYALIRKLNKELEQAGKFVTSGRVLRAYYLKRTGIE